MNVDNSRRYFEDIRSMGRRLEIVGAEIKELIDLSERAGALDYSKERVQTGEAVKEPAFVKALDQAERRKETYDKMLIEYTKHRQDAWNKLYMLSNDLDVEALHKRYFLFMSIKDIAKEMRYSQEAIKYHINNGLKEFERRNLWQN